MLCWILLPEELNWYLFCKTKENSCFRRPQSKQNFTPKRFWCWLSWRWCYVRWLPVEYIPIMFAIQYSTRQLEHLHDYLYALFSRYDRPEVVYGLRNICQTIKCRTNRFRNSFVPFANLAIIRNILLLLNFVLSVTKFCLFTYSLCFYSNWYFVCYQVNFDHKTNKISDDISTDCLFTCVHTNKVTQRNVGKAARQLQNILLDIRQPICGFGHTRRASDYFFAIN